MLIAKYRPQQAASYLFANPEHLRLYNRLIGSETLPHIILYGRPGTGKTSFFEVLFNKMLIGEEYFNLVKIDTAYTGKELKLFRQQIERETSKNLAGFGHGRHIVFIDEADQMVPTVQQWLKSNIEKLQHRVTFCMTTNHIDRIDDAVKRRCLKFCIEDHKPEIMKQKLEWVARKENIAASPAQIDSIIKQHGSNIGNCLNELELL
jgi:DNA polymerase III delta prime subunit